MVRSRRETPESSNLDHPLLLITDRDRTRAKTKEKTDQDRTERKEKQYLYSISEDRFNPVRIPEFEEMIVLGSAYGWIMVAHPKQDNCFIWNPSSMERIDIGILKYAFLYNRCVMSNSPSEPGFCHILFYNSDWYCRNPCLLEDGETLVPPTDNTHADYGDKPDSKVIAAASFQGKIYCVLKPNLRRREEEKKKKPRKRKPEKRKFYCAGSHFATFDFDGDNVEYSPIFRDFGRHWHVPNWKHHCMEIHMVESPCGEELLLVQQIFRRAYVWEDMEIKVFLVDFAFKECVEVDNIGDRTIFLSTNGASFCCSTSSSSGSYRRNCIYYTIDDKESRCVYVYDMENRSRTPVLPCPAARRSRSVSFWIQNNNTLAYSIRDGISKE